MNESQTRYDLIDPALGRAGWNDAPARIAVEQQVAPGRVESDGHSHKGNSKAADYVLMYGTRRMAVVEAKASDAPAEKGEAQARWYADALGVRFAYATNGHDVLRIDMETQTTARFAMEWFPTPAELLAALGPEELPRLELACRKIPWARPGGRGIRYYQERAVEAVIAAIGRGERNALLTLATGTGKTYIAFQIANKLVQARWSHDALGMRKPRILFLADRKILADQAMEGFALGEGDCFRLDAGAKKPPMDRVVYFTLYQTLLGEAAADDAPMAEPGKAQPQAREAVRYQAFPRDFFDLVIVDECHRGGVNDESQWRAALDYFASATHLGLTATPKCDVNNDTYAYFGKPVYVYSLKQGIVDGFLSPYRVCRINTSIDDYQQLPGDRVSEPDRVDPERTYHADEIHRAHLHIEERDRFFVTELFKRMPLDQKAIAFCVTQEHAAQVMHVIREEAAKRGHAEATYCERVTADDGDIGEQYLREFRNSENTLPTILVTSQKLSTGVDACNLRSIVLLRSVKSMVEFKQIIGRGTRIYDGKPYFTIYDFTGATDKFKDPGWDGEVLCQKCGQNPCVCAKSGGKGGGGGGGGGPHPPCPVCGCWPCACPKPAAKPVEITLATGRTLTVATTEKLLLDSEMLSVEEFLMRFFRAVRELKLGPDELTAAWADEGRRERVLAALKECGFDQDRLMATQKLLKSEECDVLDMLLDVAWSKTRLRREMRAERARSYVAALPPEQRKFAELILKNYVHDGVWTLNRRGFNDLLKMRYNSVLEARRKLSVQDTADWFQRLQSELYRKTA